MEWHHSPANYNGSGQPELWHATGRAGWVARVHGPGDVELRQEGSRVARGTLTEMQAYAVQVERQLRRRARRGR
jgi:hypothetical protein